MTPPTAQAPNTSSAVTPVASAEICVPDNPVSANSNAYNGYSGMISLAADQVRLSLTIRRARGGTVRQRNGMARIPRRNGISPAGVVFGPGLGGWVNRARRGGPFAWGAGLGLRLGLEKAGDVGGGLGWSPRSRWRVGSELLGCGLGWAMIAIWG
jgi:hypothetical protein